MTGWQSLRNDSWNDMVYPLVFIEKASHAAAFHDPSYAFAALALRTRAGDATVALLNGRRTAPVVTIAASTASLIPSTLIEAIDIISEGGDAWPHLQLIT